MNNKGQAGLEAIMVVAAVFLIVIVILSYYGSFNDSTVAMAILKSNTLERLAELDTPYVIVKIDYVDFGAGAIDLTVETLPSKCLENTKIDGSNNWRTLAINKIIANTGYTIVTLDFNPGEPAC